MPAALPISAAPRALAALSPRIIYSRHYNIGFFGLERLHPFDSRKYGRAWRAIRRNVGPALRQHHIRPPRPVSKAELLTVHTADYLKRLKKSAFVAGVLEVPPLRFLPAWAIDRLVLHPMRWAAMGTIIAARAALDHGLAINLGGGYHHARANDGHGFCVYADVGLAVQSLRTEGRLADVNKIAYIDVDAHQGNGVCRTFYDDRRVFIYDQYNRHTFPHDVHAQRRIDCDAYLGGGCASVDYLATLRKRLPDFLDGITRGGPLRLAIYNAGTDIYEHDQLGGLNVSAAAILERDQFALSELVGRGIPTMMLLSGGYSRASFQLVADTVSWALETWGK